MGLAQHQARHRANAQGQTAGSLFLTLEPPRKRWRTHVCLSKDFQGLPWWHSG